MNVITIKLVGEDINQNQKKLINLKKIINQKKLINLINPKK